MAEPFRRASCWAQLTSGAGIKPGGDRLFYWLDRPASGAELKRWLGDVPGLDKTLNDVTPNYVARPIFDGVADPVPVRLRLIPGELDEVAVPDCPPRRHGQCGRLLWAPRRRGGRLLPDGQRRALRRRLLAQPRVRALGPAPSDLCSGVLPAALAR